MRLAPVFLLLVGSAAAAPVPKDFKPADDAKRIVGTWNVVKLNGGDEGPTAWFRFDADGGMQTLNRTPGDVPQTWTFTLDPKGTPKRLRCAQGNTAYDCLYELTGTTLKFGFITDKTKGLPETVEPHPALTLYEMTRAAAAK